MSIGRYNPSWMNNDDLAYATVVKDFLARMLSSVRTQVLTVVTSMTSPIITATTSITTPTIKANTSITLSNTAEGSTAGFVIQTARQVHTLSLAATSDTTTISIPVGAMLLGVQMNVNTAVTTSGATNTWSSAFITGSTTTISTGTAGALNTKVNLLLVPEITTGGVAQIRFDAAGAETFATGVIEVLVYYATLTPMANA